jgi:hypothetical protein
MHKAVRVGAFVALPLLLATACARQPAAQAGFGPPEPAPSHATPTAQARMRIAPGYLASRSVPMPKAVRLQQTRIDALDPKVQNWEVQLDLLRSGAQNADQDELFAIWMTGQASPNGRTHTEIGLAHSGDGARSFERVELQSPIAEDAVPFDPIVGFDPATQRTLVSVMEQTPPFTRQLWVARSNPGQSLRFEPGRLLPNGVGEVPDKGWFAVGRDQDDASRSVIYLSTRAGMRLSRDGGETWEGPMPLPGSSNLLQPLTLDDGTLLVAYLSTGGQALLVRSDDMGRSFSAPVAIHTFVGDIGELSNPAIPGSFRAPPTTMLAKGRNGRVYALLHDVVRREGAEADLDVLLFSSDDGGRTWSAGRNLTSDSPPFSDQFLPWLAEDAQGRLHLAYFDTSRFVGVDADLDALVDAWYAMSEDGGATWSRTRLTQQPIDSFGTRWSPTSDAPIAQFLGDYFTLAVSRHAAYVAHPVHVNGVYGMTVSRIDFDAAAGGVIRDPRGLSGLWYEPATSGQGFEFNWLAGDALALAFYGHRDNGANLFLTGLRAGRFAYGETLDIPLTGVSGGRFNDFDRDAIRSTPWGRLTLRFDSCSSAHARLEGADGTKELALVRLAVAPDLPCD